MHLSAIRAVPVPFRRRGRAPIQSGGYSGGVPPLPIPNREVKPVIADGTAMQCGRVGSRLLLVGGFPETQSGKPPVFCACFYPLFLFIAWQILFLSVSEVECNVVFDGKYIFFVENDWLFKKIMYICE